MNESRDCWSWGRYRPPDHNPLEPASTDAVSALLAKAGTFLPYGCGRSYGDSCLNHEGKLIAMAGLDQILDIDPQSRRLLCEAGTTLGAILDHVEPFGLTLPVVPGTRLITVGGAIANDIHGKNHLHAGSFGAWVRSFELLRSDGQRLTCSLGHEPELFGATIGGLGLTGVILTAELELVPMAPSMRVHYRVVRGFQSYLELEDEFWAHDQLIALMDASQLGSREPRGIFTAASACEEPVSQKSRTPRRARAIPVPLLWPAAMAWNRLYFERHRRLSVVTQHPDAVLFPLDLVHEWNRVYGRRGFFQLQFVLPREEFVACMHSVVDAFKAHGQWSTLTVLKSMGEQKSPGLMSFPRPGISAACDLANLGVRTKALFERLHRIVLDLGGIIYPAKDAWMTPSQFRQCFPRMEKFAQHVDPKLCSSFWRRVTSIENRC